MSQPTASCEATPVGDERKPAAPLQPPPDASAGFTAVRGALSAAGVEARTHGTQATRPWCADPGSPRTPGMPRRVLEAVVECMSESMASVYWEMCHRRRGRFIRSLQGEDTVCNVNDEARSLLSTMSLVHRTWTPVAYRILPRRVLIKSPWALVAFEQSVHCGPRTLELGYCPAPALIPNRDDDGPESTEDNSASTDDGTESTDDGTRSTGDDDGATSDSTDADEEPRPWESTELQSVLRKTTSLVFFGCVFPKASHRDGNMDRLLERIGQMATLRGLWLGCRDSTSREAKHRQLHRACLAVSRLPVLACLQVDGWLGPRPSSKPAAEELTAAVLGRSPPSSLRTLSIDVGGGVYGPLDPSTTALSAWLLKPQGGFSLKHLQVRGITAFDVPAHFTTETLKSLETVDPALDSYMGPGHRLNPLSETASSSGSDFLGRCSELKTLYVKPTYLYGQLLFPDRGVPPCVERIVVWSGHQEGTAFLEENLLTNLDNYSDAVPNLCHVVCHGLPPTTTEMRALQEENNAGWERRGVSVSRVPPVNDLYWPPMDTYGSH